MYYYIYKSDAKIDMLYSQIENLDTPLSNISFDLRFVKIDRERNKNQLEKLDVLKRYIFQDPDFGCDFSKNNWIEYTIPMKWGPIGDFYRPSVVFFSGFSDTHIICLTGSWGNVVGHSSAEFDTTYFGSSIPMFMGYMAAQVFRDKLDLPPKEDVNSCNDFCGEIPFNPKKQNDLAKERDLRTMSMYGVKMVNKYGSPTNMNFLARKLYEGKLSEANKKLLAKFLGRKEITQERLWFGTPLYVTLYPETSLDEFPLISSKVTPIGSKYSIKGIKPKLSLFSILKEYKKVCFN